MHFLLRSAPPLYVAPYSVPFKSIRPPETSHPSVQFCSLQKEYSTVSAPVVGSSENTVPQPSLPQVVLAPPYIVVPYSVPFTLISPAKGSVPSPGGPANECKTLSVLSAIAVAGSCK